MFAYCDILCLIRFYFSVFPLSSRIELKQPFFPFPLPLIEANGDRVIFYSTSSVVFLFFLNFDRQSCQNLNIKNAFVCDGQIECINFFHVFTFALWGAECGDSGTKKNEQAERERERTTRQQPETTTNSIVLIPCFMFTN